MLTRRVFLGGGMLGAIAGTATPGWTRVSCRAADDREQICHAEVNFDAFLEEAYDTQHASQWCWAACIAMVFAFYGHPVRQERIVAEAYGGVYNLPSGSGFNIAKQLDRPWVDERGRTFRSRLLSVFDAHAGSYDLDYAMVVDALAKGRPLIVGTRDHTVVLTAVEYTAARDGARVLGAGVFDPWPGIGPRDLAADEMVPLSEGGSLGFVALPAIA